MSFFRRTPQVDPLDWANYQSAEDFALGLMLEGVPTDSARRLLREALDANEVLRGRFAVEYQRRRDAADLAERRRDGAVMAAAKLLSEVGYRESW